MDAVEFLKEKNRMMRTDSEAYSEIKDIPTVQAVVAYVEDWSHKHPYKTVLQDFLEKYPNAKFDSELKIPKACCSDLGYFNCDGGECKECWYKPVEE